MEDRIMKKDYTIAVAGTGYVGLSIATLLSQHHKVMAVDIVKEKVDLINNRKSPIQDNYIEKYLAEKELNLTATLDAKEAYSNADFVVIAAPTNYDSATQHFDTSAVEAVIKLVMEYNPEAIMVIKSTIPVGYTQSIREKTGSKNIIFSPEFLRESKALYDNLYPSRIIVGTDLNDEKLVNAAHEFAALLQEGAIKENDDPYKSLKQLVQIKLKLYANKHYEVIDNFCKDFQKMQNEDILKFLLDNENGLFNKMKVVCANTQRTLRMVMNNIIDIYKLIDKTHRDIFQPKNLNN